VPCPKPQLENRRDVNPVRRSSRRWSQRVIRESNALDLDRSVFSKSDPKRIAASLKRSAERSQRRKSNPYRLALSTSVTASTRQCGRGLNQR